MNSVVRFVVLQVMLVALAGVACKAIGACTPAQRAEVRAADNFLCADVRPLVDRALASSSGEATSDAGSVEDGGDAVELSFVVRATRRHRHHGDAGADAGADAGDAGDAGDGGR